MDQQAGQEAGTCGRGKEDEDSGVEKQWANSNPGRVMTYLSA